MSLHFPNKNADIDHIKMSQLLIERSSRKKHTSSFPTTSFENKQTNAPIGARSVHFFSFSCKMTGCRTITLSCWCPSRLRNPGSATSTMFIFWVRLVSRVTFFLSDPVKLPIKPVTDPEFPRDGFGHFLPKTSWKWKKFDREQASTPLPLSITRNQVETFSYWLSWWNHFTDKAAKRVLCV